MTDIAIRCEGLGKQYRIGERERYKALRDTITDTLSAPFRRLRAIRKPQSAIRNPEFWALKDVSFEVKRGEVVGIIGRNGAGKSTLLKILSRITAPSAGEVEIRGRVGSLLEVGTGFHPELTGRENLYLNGAILGMKKAEIERKFDEIVAFAEIEKFIDTPVKRYSSGMYVRLAFAVAAHMEPEILVIDEVLAVGDAAFQKKCLGKMGDVAKEGRTVLFVSHNMAAVKRLCKKSIWINHGRIIRFDKTDSTLDDYLSYGQVENGEFYASPLDEPKEHATARLLRVSVKDRNGTVTNIIASDAPLFLEIEYEFKKRLENVRVGYRLLDNQGTVVFTSGDTDPEGVGTQREAGVYVSRCMIPSNFLNNGCYLVTVACDVPMQEVLFFEENVVSFTVQLTGGVGGVVPDGRLGVVRPHLQWNISHKNHTYSLEHSQML
jgi:lipopolysaccharide transport system ATP-binding protein